MLDMETEGEKRLGPAHALPEELVVARGPCSPAILTKSATLIRREGSDLTKMTLSLISSSSGFVSGKAGRKLPLCEGLDGLVADSSIFCFSILAACRTAQPLTDILVEESGVIR